MCETDFVARNEVFQKLAGDISTVVFETGLTAVNEVQKQSLPDGLSVGEHINEVIAKMGENIVLRRCCSLSTASPTSILCRYSYPFRMSDSYQHNLLGPNMSQIAALVSFSVEGDTTKVDRDALRKISMHVAAANPTYLKREEVPPDVLERERALILETVKNLNKPEKIVNRMLEGKVGEFYKQTVLLDQLFILDEKQGSISKVLQKLGKESGCKLGIEKFIRLQVGK